ncbi:MAG: alkanesulfonate monooxygenase SsuD [Acidimicrobiales bacterium]|jgi:alkanesulfonate monooxygenase SsuD/methylene tetrahydromethanopterin reductase-like flavin-dependent oxidoreductase (luciferase family)
MRFETFHLLSTPEMESGVDVYRYTMDQIRLAEAAGFETSWFAEHHFSNYGFCPNPFLPIVKAAAITERIRFGQAITVLPIWHPLRLVEDINVTDILCEGRLNVGFGRGYQPGEFEALGTKLADSQARFDEAVQIMTKAWTEDDFTFEGQHWSIPNPLTVLPKPVQAPHPPLFVAASSPNTFVRAANEGYGVLSSGASLTLDQVGEAYQRFAGALDKAGRPRDSAEFHSLRFVHVAKTDEEAAKHIETSRWNGRVASALHGGDDSVTNGWATDVRADGEPDDDEWAKRLVFGSPETVIAKLKQLDDIGISHVVCHFDFASMQQPDILASMELFAEQVMPAFEGSIVGART